MLLRFAKLAGGLRVLVSDAAPIVATSASLLSARTAAYLVGFALSNIASIWLPIVAVLVSITGFFGAGANNPECEAYRAQMRAIDNANRAAMANYQATYKIWADGPYKAWLEARVVYINSFPSCLQYGDIFVLGGCDYHTNNNRGCSASYTYYGCISFPPPYSVPVPIPPLSPILQTYPACSSPDCPPGKKVWVQVLWASPSGNASDAKGCFIAAYSQDAPDLPPDIQYNPFLPKEFVKSRAISYYLVDGDRFRGLQDNDWKNLESVSGWDKGYWKAEQTDPECRGWRPGWSRKIK